MEVSSRARVPIVWADDDSEHRLKIVGILLTHAGLNVSTATNYLDACTLLDTIVDSGAGNGLGLLVDVVLPRANGGALGAMTLGVSVARKAIALGVKRVAFYSVVSEDRMKSALYSLNEIARRYDAVLTYFEKSSPDPATTITAMANFFGA